MVKENVTDSYLVKNIHRLINTYDSQIDEDMRNFIIDRAIQERDEIATYDILMQAYDEIGVLEDANVYNDFIDLLDNLFGIGYTSNLVDMERDYVYQYYLFGIFGIILLILIYIFFYIFNVLKIFDSKYFNYNLNLI